MFSCILYMRIYIWQNVKVAKYKDAFFPSTVYRHEIPRNYELDCFCNLSKICRITSDKRKR